VGCDPSTGLRMMVAPVRFLDLSGVDSRNFWRVIGWKGRCNGENDPESSSG